LFSKKEKLDSEIGERLRAQLKRKWEAKHGRKLSRCAEVFSQREQQYQAQVKYNEASRQVWIAQALREIQSQQMQERQTEAQDSATAPVSNILGTLKPQSSQKLPAKPELEY